MDVLVYGTFIDADWSTWPDGDSPPLAALAELIAADRTVTATLE